MKIHIFQKNSDEWDEYANIHNVSHKDFYAYNPIDFFRNSGYMFALEDRNGLLCALAEMDSSSGELDAMAVFFLSVKTEQRRKGYASVLLKEMFNFCKGKNLALRMSSYTHEGFWTFRRLALKLELEMGVELREQGLIDPPYTRAEEIYGQTRSKDLTIYKHKDLILDPSSKLFKEEKCIVPFKESRAKEQGMFHKFVKKNF